MRQSVGYSPPSRIQPCALAALGAIPFRYGNALRRLTPYVLLSRATSILILNCKKRSAVLHYCNYISKVWICQYVWGKTLLCGCADRPGGRSLQFCKRRENFFVDEERSSAWVTAYLRTPKSSRTNFLKYTEEFLVFLPFTLVSGIILASVCRIFVA